MASVNRSLAVRRGRRAAATAPTWLARIVSRREWNAPPRGTRGCAVPYQESSINSASSPSNCKLRARPDSVAEQWRTRSLSRAASSGCTSSTPKAAARVDSGGVHIHQLKPVEWKSSQQGGQHATHHARAHHGHAVTDPWCGVPERIDACLDCAGQHCTIARHFVWHCSQGARRHHVTILVWVQAEHPAALERRRTLLDDADR